VDIISWFNGNAGFAMALLTAVYVVATMLIVLESRRTNRIQRRLLEQAEELERSRRRPYVVFSLDFEHKVASRHDTLIYVYASIQNFGATSAHRITVRTTPSLQGRLGVDSGPRKPAIVDSEITFLPPGHSKRDLVGLSEFLFKDHADEALRYAVIVQYADIVGTAYREEYVIDLAAQKETLETTDVRMTLQHQMLEQVGRLSGSLGEVAKILGSPDRSLFLALPGVQLPIDSSQRELLSALVAGNEEGVKEFLVTQSFGDEMARIRPLHSKRSMEISAFASDVEYLCRAGALHGHYRHGMLWFSVTPLARDLLSVGDVQKEQLSS